MLRLTHTMTFWLNDKRANKFLQQWFVKPEILQCTNNQLRQKLRIVRKSCCMSIGLFYYIYIWTRIFYQELKYLENPYVTISCMSWLRVACRMYCEILYLSYIYIYIYIYIMDLVVRGIWQHIYYAEGWYIIPRGNILSNSLSGGSINTIGKTSKHSDGKTSKTEAKQAIILMAKQLFLVLSLLTASFWYSCKLISLLCRGNTL